MTWPDPLIIADDRTLAILGQNKAADRMFVIAPFIQKLAGRIHFSDLRVAEEFHAQVRDPDGDPIAVCIDRIDGDCVLAARIERMLPDTQPNVVTLTFRGRVNGQDVSGQGTAWPSLTKLFELTPAEERVARLLTTGDAVHAIGAQLGVSVDTVRSHAQKIYLKVGVANREQLIARLSPLAFSGPRIDAHGDIFAAGDVRPA